MKALIRKPRPETVESLKKLETLQFDKNVARVQYGITEDAHLFLRRCALFLEVGRTPPFPYAIYLAECLLKLASGKTPWGAALLKKGRGKNSIDQFDHDFGIASEVWKLIHVPSRRRRQTVEMATGNVARQHKMQPARVEDLYYKYRPILDREESRSLRARAAQLPDSARAPVNQELLDWMEADAGKGLPDEGLLMTLRAYIDELEDRLDG